MRYDPPMRVLPLVMLSACATDLTASSGCVQWDGEASAHCTVGSQVADIEPGDEWCPDLCGEADVLCRFDGEDFFVRVTGGCS